MAKKMFNFLHSTIYNYTLQSTNFSPILPQNPKYQTLQSTSSYPHFTLNEKPVRKRDTGANKYHIIHILEYHISEKNFLGFFYFLFFISFLWPKPFFYFLFSFLFFFVFLVIVSQPFVLSHYQFRYPYWPIPSKHWRS